MSKKYTIQSLSIYPASFLLKRLLSLWKDIVESVSGTEQDFTKGKISRAILLLSIPMVLEMAMESLFAIVDIFFVSKLGADAVAVVGITESLMSIVYAVGIGLGTAATALVSRRIGEKDPDGASRGAFQAILLSLGASLIFSIPALLFSSHILHLMGLSRGIAGEYGLYTAIVMGSNGIIILLFVINAVFRSAGDAAVSMRVLWLANILNMILDPILIFGIGPFEGWGITGAAIATTIGRGIAVIYQIMLLVSGQRRIAIRKRHLQFKPKVIRTLLNLSYGTIGQNLIATSSWIGLVRIISVFGSAAVAGYTIAIRIVIFSLLPSAGVSNAAATLVGQNLGANEPKRAERSAWITAWVNVVLLGTLGLFFIAFPSGFVGLFIGDEEVIRRGAECLRILSYGFIAYGFGMVMINSLNGAGDTATPLKINIVCYWMLEIPLAYILAIYSGMGEIGVFYSILIAEVAMTATAMYFFKRGKWKTVELR